MRFSPSPYSSPVEGEELLDTRIRRQKQVGRMTKIAEGIYHLEVALGVHTLGNIGIYVIKSGSECAIIDTGFDTKEGLESLTKQLKEIDIEITDITQIIATHAHGDHYGMAGTLRKLSKATIALHYLEKASNDRLTHEKHDPEQMEKWFSANGAPPTSSLERKGFGPFRHHFMSQTEPDIVLQGDETLHIGDNNLKVIWTPGHAAGHIVLYEADKKILFAGDHVLPRITPNVAARSDNSTDALGQFINSLNTVRKLEADTVLPAHGKPFHTLQKRVDEIIGHHEERNGEILNAVKARPMTGWEIAGAISWLKGRGGKKFEDLLPMDKRLAIMETLSHIDYLKNEGKLKKSVENGVIYYSGS
jgi:glyoxylase-like metal-dependent hydrolase (beta-lactamase superfamily II)